MYRNRSYRLICSKNFFSKHWMNEMSLREISRFGSFHAVSGICNSWLSQDYPAALTCWVCSAVSIDGIQIDLMGFFGCQQRWRANWLVGLFDWQYRWYTIRLDGFLWLSTVMVYKPFCWVSLAVNNDGCKLTCWFYFYCQYRWYATWPVGFVQLSVSIVYKSTCWVSLAVNSDGRKLTCWVCFTVSIDGADVLGFFGCKYRWCATWLVGLLWPSVIWHTDWLCRLICWDCSAVITSTW